MRKLLRATFLAMFLGSMLAVHSECPAQEGDQQYAAEETSPSWYQQPQTYQPNTRAIIHEKAFVRASQRQARLAATNWYGMYNGRPTAAPTPFTSMYSPAWQTPGGRPFAWAASSRPTYVFYR